MTQYSLGVGLKKFKNKVTTTVSEDLQHLHDLEAFTLIDISKMKTEKLYELESLMFLKEKYIHMN